MVRGLYKQPGGKLVGVAARLSHASCTDTAPAVEWRIDGDFFLDGDECDAQRLLHSMEIALKRQYDDDRVCDPDTIERKVACTIDRILRDYPDVRIIGMDARGIAIAFRRAIAGLDVDGESREAPLNRIENRKPQSPKTEQSNGTGGWNEYARRWHALKPRIVHDAPRKPQEQMDVDVAWAREVADGTREPTLRIWEWAAPAVVIGKFQSLEDEVNVRTAQDEGFRIVRRCTGGGAMFIEPGNTITYSLYTPLDFAHGMTIEESYKLCDYWLVEALRGLGLDVRFAGLNDIATQYGKLGGAAQRRFAPTHGGPGAILHHVTLAYDIDAEKMARVLNVSREKMSDKAVKSAIKRVDPMRSQTGMSRDEVVARLIDAARRVTI